MGRIKPARLVLSFLGLGGLALAGYASGLGAGDIVGAIAVPKPDQAVVFLAAVPGSFSAGRAQMNQQGKVFIPYVLPIIQGTTVEFHNGDDLAHNVFGIGAEEFNLGSFTKGNVREHTFNKLGEVTILCNVHPEMEGHILVLQNPYFAKPDGSGKFHIAKVPTGDYVIEAWYADKIKKQSVKVAANGSVTVTF